MTALLLAYAAGVLIGLWRADAPLPQRLALAALWPVGVLAFLVTMTGLAALALVGAPAVGALLGALAVAMWWIMR